jgi:primosomal protein N'
MFRVHTLVCGPEPDILRQAVRQVTTDVARAPGQVEWTVDVDPVDML